MEKEELEDSMLGKLKRVKHKTITMPVERLVQTSYLVPGNSLPLVIQPAIEGVDIAEWITSNRDFLEANLHTHGAILFRGFNLSSIPAFERMAQANCRELYTENSEHMPVVTDGHVQVPVYFAPDKKLLWHNENSFNDSWPMKIMFGCIHAAEQGGETPLVDSRKVFEAMNPDIREAFVAKKVMYVRNYGTGLGLEWQRVFRTQDKAEVEAQCHEMAIDFEWRDNDGLRTRAIRPAVGRHPQTKQMVWFNQAQHWHIACLDGETRAALLSIFPAEELPRSCYFGDGSPIEDEVMAEICRVYQELEVAFPWLDGDFVLLDNMLTAHGRNPYVGERKLLVAMGEMVRYSDL